MNRLRNLRTRLRQELKWLSSDALFAAGFGANRHRNRPGGRVIVYHGIDAIGSLAHNTRFISEATLFTHLSYFRDHCEVVSLTDYFAGRRASDRLTVSVTFDDGHYNNLERALPIVERLGDPVTVFVTGCAETDGEILWPDLLDLSTPAAPSRIEAGGEIWVKGRRGEFVAEDTGESLKVRCKRSSFDFIQKILAALRPFFEGRDPDRFADYWRHLSTEEIRRLAVSDFVAIGSHGASHTCLGAIDHKAAVDELQRSKDYLEQATDTEITMLAYPDGSYTRNLVKSATAMGFEQQYLVNYHHPDDAKDPRLRERLGNNPLISWNNQLWSILQGRY